MKNDIHPIVYRKEHNAVMANDIVKGKQDMTLQEARIIRLVITQIAKEDNDLRTYTCNIKDLADFLKIDDSNLYREIKNICGSLAQRVVWVGTGNPRTPWEVFPWLQLAKYDGNGKLTLMLSERMKPYVIDLNRYFTQYRLENILEMNSFYSIRLYELLKCDDFKKEEYREYSIEFLRQFFDCEKKYKLFADFKRRVLEAAIKEINLKSDIEIREVEYKKDSRKVSKVRFLVWDNYAVIDKRNNL